LLILAGNRRNGSAEKLLAINRRFSMHLPLSQIHNNQIIGPTNYRAKLSYTADCSRCITFVHKSAKNNALISTLVTTCSCFERASINSLPFFQDITHPSSSLYHLFPLHVIRLSCFGSERPHGLHVLSHAPKNIAPLLITP